MCDPQIETLRESMRKTIDERHVTLGRKPGSKAARNAELEFLCGAAQALETLDHPLKQAPLTWAFLHAIGRDPLR